MDFVRLVERASAFVRARQRLWVTGDIGHVEILSPKHGRYVASFDADQTSLVGSYRWVVTADKGIPRYVSAKVSGKTTGMHALVIPNCPVGFVRDHINHDGFDNRLSNLRLVSASHNAFHRRTRRHKQGVNKIGEVYGSRLELGMFPTEDAAHQAWKDAYELVFGALPECIAS